MKSISFKLLLAFVCLAGLLTLFSGCQKAEGKEIPDGSSVVSTAFEAAASQETFTEPEKNTESPSEPENKNDSEALITTEATEGETQNAEISETTAKDTEACYSTPPQGIVLPDDNW